MRVFLPADPFIHIRMFSDFLLKKYVTGKLSQPPMLHSLNTVAGKHNERLTGKWGSENGVQKNGHRHQHWSKSSPLNFRPENLTVMREMRNR
jgi:hypothetical protein